MRLQQNKGSHLVIIPKHMVEWLMWEKGDDISVCLRQDKVCVELICFNKKIIKEELLKKDRAVESLERERDLKQNIANYEHRINELKQDLKIQGLKEKEFENNIEASQLKSKKENNDVALGLIKEGKLVKVLKEDG